MTSPHPPAARGRLAWALLPACMIAIALLALASLMAGARPLSLATVEHALTAFDAGDNEHLLLRHLRLPRTVLALVAGGALGVAGALMQTLTRNPLADPGLLGVNAGAAAAIAAAMALGAAHGPARQVMAGFAGAAGDGALVYAIGGLHRAHDPLRLVLAGAAISAILLAVTQLITLNSEERVFDQFRHWVVGSLQGRSGQVLVAVLPAVALGAVGALALARALDALALGQDLGKSLGARPRLVWIGTAVVIVLLAGAATAAAGPLAFIGLAAPHVARHVCGPGHRRVIPCAALVGACLLLAADTLGRVIAAPDEISAGIMAAVLGGPLFVALARRAGMG
ncbi:FecCD family ABC transporter permease [Achromobacter insuavis]|uniref:FecCD family ABC transporter permease n=1 Tax=Achromobacter insuavis TaxID=1287735 RepID=UPI00359F7A8A